MELGSLFDEFFSPIRSIKLHAVLLTLGAYFLNTYHLSPSTLLYSI